MFCLFEPSTFSLSYRSLFGFDDIVLSPFISLFLTLNVMQDHENRAMHSVAELHGRMLCKKRALNRAVDEREIWANLDGCELLRTRVRKEIRQRVNSIGTAVR